MQIIGITGPAGSGKSTVARILCDRYGFIELSFAAPIRDFVQRLTGLSNEAFDAAKELPMESLCGNTPRFAMQTLGTEWGRLTLSSDLWLRQLDLEIERRADNDSRIVISDARFQNEAKWLREVGELWHLTRPGHAVNPHVSELGITPTDRDVTLDNDCDIPTLHYRIAAILGEGCQL
jgi:hypothetical protein